MQDRTTCNRATQAAASMRFLDDHLNLLEYHFKTTQLSFTYNPCRHSHVGGKRSHHNVIDHLSTDGVQFMRTTLPASAHIRVDTSVMNNSRVFVLALRAMYLPCRARGPVGVARATKYVCCVFPVLRDRALDVCKFRRRRVMIEVLLRYSSSAVMYTYPIHK